MSSTNNLCLQHLSPNIHEFKFEKVTKKKKYLDNPLYFIYVHGNLEINFKYHDIQEKQTVKLQKKREGARV